MRKTALTLIFIFALSVLLITGMQNLQVVRANFLPAPVVAIYSPFGLYTNTSVPLSVVVRVLHDSPRIVCVLYSLDGKSNVTLTNLTRTDNEWFDPNKWGSVFSVTSVLENLAEGNHTLNVYSQDAAGNEMSSSVEFTIDTHYKYPEIVILSPQNKTYAATEVPLTFTCNKKILSADYILEGEGGHEPISGNTILTGLMNGTHTITVIVWAEGGSAYQTVCFNIDNQTSTVTPEPFPTTLVITASGASLAVVGIGLLVYFKKRKRKADPL